METGNRNYIPHSRPTLGEEEIKAVAAVIQSGHIAEGEVVKKFERAFAEKLNVSHAVATSSGTAALHLALMSLGIGTDDEVIIPSYVCSALLYAVRYVGATPVVADIDPVTHNIAPQDVQKRVTSRTKAIIVPHLFGLAADLDNLAALGVPLIEDCAQAVGATYQQRPLGTYGAAAIFSFYATKVMTTSEGGMLVSNSKELIERVRDLKTYDQKQATNVRFNYKMTDISAALGLVQLSRLDAFVERRREIARRYYESFKTLNLKLPVDDREHLYYRFVVNLEKDCESSIRKLTQKGIGCARPVFLPIHRHLKIHSFPVSDEAWRTSLSIPIYPSLTDKEIERIINGFMDGYK
jgi:dTDP-4-amino-4,6-dideoxygalactose transaminase